MWVYPNQYITIRYLHVIYLYNILKDSIKDMDYIYIYVYVYPIKYNSIKQSNYVPKSTIYQYIGKLITYQKNDEDFAKNKDS